MPNALATSAIATSVIIVVAALIIIAMALWLIKEQRNQPRSKRVSIIPPVIDICRPVHSNVDGDSIAAPQRPREAFLPSRQPSPDIRVVSRYEGTPRQTRLHSSPGPAELVLDLEAQSRKPSKEKRNAKAERFYSPSCGSPPVELPMSPPPSYSQIDKSLLVAVL